ncbi:RNAse PH [Pelagirhabdus alkalitolerans]|uniref:Ribonuclease PH n=1 Tax=Pelagirhabdus alkalitolerans TaxID=1612202 RepID=A0A1G6HMD4_9BACI|nr:ribonuclease PH [Pelagirhabdus alkalitolerans]SDB95313.1 RNAse PH [Pelagirhabdus alkalitolerans]
MRASERELDQLRSITIDTEFTKHPEGSVLITVGDTKVICNASIENRVPPFMRNQGKGWITAEYSMLPRATESRNIRESSKGKVSGRTMEIQRLIGRALRSVVNLDHLGERTIWVDCDVIQADGGTRTASITGAFVAVTLAVGKLVKDGEIDTFPITDFLNAISVGIMPDGTAALDLEYVEDAEANVDMNVVMTGSGEFVEIQGTGEEATFTPAQLQEMLSLATKGLQDILECQKEAIGEFNQYFESSEA